MVMQPWYADYSRARGYFRNIHIHIEKIMVKFPSHGYSLEPTKSILVISEKNDQRDQELSQGMSLKVVTGIQYFGGFIRYGTEEATWIGEKVRGR